MRSLAFPNIGWQTFGTGGCWSIFDLRETSTQLLQNSVPATSSHRNCFRTALFRSIFSCRDGAASLERRHAIKDRQCDKEQSQRVVSEFQPPRGEMIPNIKHELQYDPYSPKQRDVQAQAARQAA